MTYNLHTFERMKNTRHNKYEVVEALPNDAMRVSEYAAQWPCNTSYIYEMVRKGKNNSFKIVIYKGINFVIPLNK